MQKPPRRLPPLDLMRGFEAAARHLSFTKAAEELFLTQSAISRQVQGLEEHLGVGLFQRKHRALLLTDEGQVLYRTVAAVLRDLRGAIDQVTAGRSARMVNVTTMVTFASLWLVPRLPKFRKLHPEIDVRISANNEVVDLERQRIDVALRYIAPEKAPRGAQRLFGEDIVPVCSPRLLRDSGLPLKKPADLLRHVLLQMDDAPAVSPWLDWDNWLAAVGLAEKPTAGRLEFSHYDHLIAAAVEGQGVALGRFPMMNDYLRSKKLVAPFERSGMPGTMPRTSRAFFVLAAGGSETRPEVQEFIAWTLQEAGADNAGDAQAEPPPAPARRTGK